MNREYKSEALAAIHEMAEGMFEVGGISKERMQEYDRECLAGEDGTEAVEEEVLSITR